MTRRLHTYDGADVTVTFDASRCIHNAHCVRHLPAVFDTAKRPWVQPDNADAAQLLAIVAGCPTGALQATARDGTTAADSLAHDANATLHLTRNGPIFVRGQVTLTDGDDTPLASDTRVALCRCGLSQRKPFCDNSHRTAGWTSEPPPPASPPTSAG